MDVDNFRLYGNGEIVLQLAGATPYDEFILLDASGLGISEHDVFMGKAVNGYSSFVSRNPHGRQIVLTLKLNPDYTKGRTTSNLRDKLYGMFGYNNNAFVWFDVRKGETTLMTVYGYISKIESSYFTKDPVAQITILCESPYFRDVNETVVQGNKQNGIQFTSNTQADTGAIIRVAPLSYSSSNQQPLQMTSTAPLTTYRAYYARMESNLKSVDDVIELDGRQGFKTATAITPSGARTNLLPSASQWAEFYRVGNGTNIISFSSAYGIISVSYYKQYLGI